MHPVFLIKPKDQRVGMNGIAMFDCVADGNPPPSVFWTKEGSQELMFAGTTHGQMHVSQTGTLTIQVSLSKDIYSVQHCPFPVSILKLFFCYFLRCEIPTVKKCSLFFRFNIYPNLWFIIPLPFFRACAKKTAVSTSAPPSASLAPPSPKPIWKSLPSKISHRQSSQWDPQIRRFLSTPLLFCPVRHLGNQSQILSGLRTRKCWRRMGLVGLRSSRQELWLLTVSFDNRKVWIEC